MKKDYNVRPSSGIGIPLDGSWNGHRSVCEKCRAVDLSRPAALAELCLEGSILWKRENVVQDKGPKVPTDENRTSSSNLRKVMRYKE